jgi:hypothetical protein
VKPALPNQLEMPELNPHCKASQSSHLHKALGANQSNRLYRTWEVSRFSNLYKTMGVAQFNNRTHIRQMDLHMEI